MEEVKELYNLKYSVAYEPKISHKAKIFIVNNIEGSMESLNGDSTFLYDLQSILKLKEFFNEKDKAILEEINKEDIAYIEF